MMRLHVYRMLCVLALSWVGFNVCLAEDASALGENLGGGTGRPIAGQNAFALPAPNISAAELRKFAFGNRLFNTNWVISGSSTKSFDGLGPIFNRVSCSGCHVRDGRGHPPEAGQPLESMLVRVSVPGQDAHGGPLHHPVYSDQIQDRSIPGVKPEATVHLTWREHAGRYEDGESYSLRSPVIELLDPQYGPLPDDLLMSPRVAQGMVGLGLLEAIPDAAILALADPQDEDGDGVSGRPNMVWDVSAEKHVIGRFGWKANQPNVRQQVAGAAAGDIGITTRLFPGDACTEAQKECQQSPNGGDPEMSDTFLDKLVFYSQTLAVPHRRMNSEAALEQGEALFGDAGCGACHVQTLQTGSHEVQAVAHQTIHPFTDLLLHDMGPGLADDRPDFKANGREWRTAPLWGIGMIPVVNGHNFLLHDGRARGLAEAILWHGGEAESARENFRKMSKKDRQALIAFLESL